MDFHTLITLLIILLIGATFGYLLGRIKKCEGVCGIDDHKALRPPA